MEVKQMTEEKKEKELLFLGFVSILAALVFVYDIIGKAITNADKVEILWFLTLIGGETAFVLFLIGYSLLSKKPPEISKTTIEEKGGG